MKRRLFGLIGAVLTVFFINLSAAVPVTGNSNGIVTLIEYYDYECPHCRRMAPVIERLQAQYPNLRVIHRVTPLLTPASRGIASIALAAQAQHQTVWVRLHRALMHMQRTPTLADAQRLARRYGVNRRALATAARDNYIQQQLQQNIQWASQHAINGSLYLPIMVFGQSRGQAPPIVLTGEQSLVLLSAIVQQLSEQHVQLAKAQQRKTPSVRRRTKSIG